MSGPISFKAVSAAVLSVKESVDEWQSLPMHQVPTVVYRGQPARGMSAAVQQAIVNLIELVDTPDVEPKAQPLVLEIDKFEKAFDAWQDAIASQGDKMDPGGSPELWGSYACMIRELKLRSYSLPEPIGTLLAMKPAMTHKKIAQVYGWYDELGNPDTQKVQEEIMTQGTHYDPKTWMHPSQRRFEKEIAEQWSARIVRLGQETKERIRKDPPGKRKKKTPETMEELIRAGTNSAQICKMCDATLETVRAKAAELGVPLDGNVVADSFRGPARNEDEKEILRKSEEMRVAAINSYPDLGADLHGRVLAMTLDKIRPGDIAKSLANAFPGLSVQKINKIIAESSRNDPATV